MPPLTSKRFPAFTAFENGLDSFTIKISNLTNREILELNEAIISLFKFHNNIETLLESGELNSDTILRVTIKPLSEEALNDLKRLIDHFISEHTDEWTSEELPKLDKASFLFENAQKFVNQNELYLPLDCPGCGRRRLIYDRFAISIRCEKCGRTGDQLDDMTTKRLGG